MLSSSRRKLEMAIYELRRAYLEFSMLSITCTLSILVIY